MYSVRLTKTAEKAIVYLVDAQPKMAARVAKAINLLAKNPHLGIPLKGELKGCWKYRVGNYRIIYQFFHQQLIIIVLDIGHRKEIYR